MSATRSKSPFRFTNQLAVDLATWLPQAVDNMTQGLAKMPIDRSRLPGWGQNYVSFFVRDRVSFVIMSY
jgi:hypothetical protein